MNAENMKIAIVGLGYVGLPLAVEFAKHYPVVGFDISESRISELKKGHDVTNEVSDEAMSPVDITGSMSEFALPENWVSLEANALN